HRLVPLCMRPYRSRHGRNTKRDRLSCSWRTAASVTSPHRCSSANVHAKIETARATDIEAVLQLVERNHLSPDGLRSRLATTLVARQNGAIVGSVALEGYPDGALLRSVAVAPEVQGQGLGRALTAAAIRLAQ